jgi:hypothetical protein
MYVGLLCGTYRDDSILARVRQMGVHWSANFKDPRVFFFPNYEALVAHLNRVV